MGPIGCPKTSVRNYRYSLRNNPEKYNLRDLAFREVWLSYFFLLLVFLFFIFFLCIKKSRIVYYIAVTAVIFCSFACLIPLPCLSQCNSSFSVVHNRETQWHSEAGRYYPHKAISLPCVLQCSRAARIAHSKNEPTDVSKTDPYLGAFAKLRKATIDLVMSVCPSVRMEQLGSHWTDFHEI